MINIEKQLKKGVLEIIVLKLLTGRDMYGYELMQILDQKSSGYYRLKEGSLYPVLYRLEDNHLIKSYWKSEEARKAVPRKYYSITGKGKKTIDILIEKWNQFMVVSNKILSLEGGNSYEK
ncbi:MAG: helix-turn-helix transcriptional regulator [Candidatus Aminicenantes bacterium]|nr:MAG: helix-turn-helix transcriptional regulator [Candidatus Aminicenantes bacterium]